MDIHAERMAVRDELRRLILEFAPEQDAALGDDTPLITSGFVESVTLLNLALWVETKIGSEVDLTTLDLAAEWDSMGRILAFVEKYRIVPGV